MTIAWFQGTSAWRQRKLWVTVHCSAFQLLGSSFQDADLFLTLETDSNDFAMSTKGDIVTTDVQMSLLAQCDPKTCSSKIHSKG